MYKKLAFVISVFVVGVLLTLATPFAVDSLFRTNSNSVNFIQFEELKEKIENNDEFLLIISKKGCPDCEDLKAELGQVEISKKLSWNIFEYDVKRNAALIEALEGIFPNFVYVPYICILTNGDIMQYEGEVSAYEIYTWAKGIISTDS